MYQFFLCLLPCLSLASILFPTFCHPSKSYAIFPSKFSCLLNLLNSSSLSCLECQSKIKLNILYFLTEYIIFFFLFFFFYTFCANLSLGPLCSHTNGFLKCFEKNQCHSFLKYLPPLLNITYLWLI